MSKVLDETSENTNELNEVKNLCVHDLKQKLREKQKKQSIKNTIVFFVIFILLGIISLIFYQKI